MPGRGIGVSGINIVGRGGSPNVGVTVAVEVAVSVAVPVLVSVAVDVEVPVAIAVTVGGASTGVPVAKGVGEGKGVRVLVEVAVGRGVPGVWVLVGVLVGVGVSVDVGVRVGRGVTDAPVASVPGVWAESSRFTMVPSVASGVGVGSFCLSVVSIGERSQPASTRINTITATKKARVGTCTIQACPARRNEFSGIS